MRDLKPIQIAKKLNSITKLNVFENTRKQEIVDLRTLLCYLMREKLNMRWVNIARFFTENGKNMTHASAIHAFKKYPIYKKDNKKLLEYEKMFTFKSDLTYDEIDKMYYLENQLKNLEEKFESPLMKLIRELPKNKENETYEYLCRFVKSWEWKSEQQQTR